MAVAVGQRRARLQDAYNYLRGRNPRTRVIEPELREKALAQLKAGQEHAVKPLHWDEFIKVLERAGFRTAAMISSRNTILYSYALWVIGRVDFEVSAGRVARSDGALVLHGPTNGALHLEPGNPDARRAEPIGWARGNP